MNAWKLARWITGVSELLVGSKLSVSVCCLVNINQRRLAGVLILALGWYTRHMKASNSSATSLVTVSLLPRRRIADSSPSVDVINAFQYDRFPL